MTVLSLTRSAAIRIGLQQPSVLMTATDATGSLLRELAQEEGRALARYADWRALRKEHTFTTVAAETQTDTPIPADLAGFIDDTIWNRSARRRIFGPVTPEQWQAWKAASSFPVTDTFTLRGTSWLMQPVPTAGQSIAYEYRSSYWCQSSGGTAQEAWVADTDTALISERLIALGIVWRFRQNRRQEWETDYAKYEFELQAELAKDRPRTIIDMKSCPPNRYPAIGTPDGSWNL